MAEWDEAVNNKLHIIHPQVGRWSRGFRIIRHEESVLAGIRIGHTPSFLLKREDPSQCIACDCRLIVKHFVLILSNLERHFNVNSFFQTIFYLNHEIGLFYRLKEILRIQFLLKQSCTCNLNFEIVHCFVSIIYLLFSTITKDHYFRQIHGTKWPLCADVPLSNHSFIQCNITF